MVRLGELREAGFLERPNRFVVVADLDGETVRAHCPNPGRLTEFLHEGNPFLLRRADAGDRVTSFDVVAGRHDGTWVVLDTRLANAVVAEGLAADRMPALAPYDRVEAEPGHGDGRLDFRLEGPAGDRLVEVKSVTLKDPDRPVGLFPDAPTKRGARHVGELADRAQDGGDASLILVAMRDDVEAIEPNRGTDPVFADAVEAAAGAGVQLLGYRTRVADGELTLGEQIPVETAQGADLAEDRNG